MKTQPAASETQRAQHGSRLRSLIHGAWAGGLVGLPSILVFLGVADLVARLVNSATPPLVAFSQLLIRLTPSDLVAFAIKSFGTNDKPILVGSVLIVFVVVTVAIASVALRVSHKLGIALYSGLELVVLGVTFLSPGIDVKSIAAGICGAGFGLGSFWLMLWFVGRSSAEHAEHPSPSQDSEAQSKHGRAGQQPQLSRRSTLIAAGVLTAGGTISLLLGRSISVLGNSIAGAVAKIRIPTPADPMSPIPASAQLDVPGAKPFITPAKDFYRIDTALTPPIIDPDSWSLRIHGMVGHEVSLTMQQLLDLPLVERTITMTCVSNPVGGNLVGNATWLGYPLRKLLEQAEPNADADMVLSKSIDGFSAGTPLGAMTDSRDAMIVIAMNGEQLLPEHGFPARLVVPGLYGFVSATKWVTELEVTRFDRAKSYWTQRGWDDHGPILPASRIDVPAPLAEVDAGTLVVAGTAWAQHTGISRVDVRLDEGDWKPATVLTEVSTDTWRQWRIEFDVPTKGLHSVTTRAVDANGNIQTAVRRDAIPNTATGQHRLQFTVR